MGSRAFKLQQNLKSVKKQLIVWNKTIFGKIDKEIKDKQLQLQHLQNTIHTVEDVKKERYLRIELENLMEREEIMWAQKARSNWIIQGDRNIKFFQTIVKQRRARNRILQLRTANGNLTKDLTEIESMLVIYFKEHYFETNSKSVDQLMEDLATIPIPKIDQQQKDLLESPVTNSEIERAVHQLGPHKAPEPDGILALFYQEFWSTVKQDILNSTHAFFHSGSLLKSLNQTFLTLIPKVQFPDDVSQFRPMSLCNVVYKIISKIMVDRLKPLMDKLITPYQNVFIRGRNITDNILLTHEIFDTLRKKKGRKKGYGALKIDMSKAYDRVNWNFLKAVLLSMNFGTTWINWVMECVTTVQYTLLVNGSPTQPFHPSRGLRQGDPISPYLFLFCANILSIALIDA